MPDPSQLGGLADRELHVDVAHFLRNARREARIRSYSDFPIVDVDAHHYDATYAPWQQIVKLIEDPVIRRRAIVGTTANGAPASMVPRIPIGDRTLGGRIQRYGAKLAPGQTDVEVTKAAMDAMGIDASILFPTALLNLQTLPEIDVQVAVSRAYARWLTEEVLPREPRLRTMVSLPFNDPTASLRMVEEFSGRPGVVGFVVGSTFYRPVHHRDYLKIYAALEERRLPLGFHSAYHWQDRLTEQFNKFLSAHGIGRTLFNIVHLTNMVINGIPERFPGLRLIWIESGITWIPFVMQRLDSEYLMRSSEAPLLRKRPSEYMREFFYTAQPLERSNNQEMMRVTFEMIGAENQLLYASDYPHWDFDLPSSIYDLPFLTDQARRRILGQNAIDLFGLKIEKTTPALSG